MKSNAENQHVIYESGTRKVFKILEHLPYKRRALNFKAAIFICKLYRLSFHAHCHEHFNSLIHNEAFEISCI